MERVFAAYADYIIYQRVFFKFTYYPFYVDVCKRIKEESVSKDFVVTTLPTSVMVFHKHDFPSSECTKPLPILHVAIGLNDQSMIDYLLSFHPTIEKIQPALLFAIKHNQLKIVEKLLAAGGNINDPMLFSTAVCCNSTEIAKLLLNRGAPVDSKMSFEGYSLLVEAAANNNVELMKILIDNGADVNILSSKNGSSTWTPLMAACSTGSKKAVEFLLDHPNIDVNIEY
ncbi:hypothetical protein KQX54_015329 [Cotesia glomerata]|uniref:Peptidase A2 domain-containing protein n=1 Tax=Cotesia glomerata TaxID=32391 RepID=A0AAV7INC5_COTGL|nr:hypothetical protein KQX54_015329 [Cotesia glomerata]